MPAYWGQITTEIRPRSDQVPESGSVSQLGVACEGRPARSREKVPELVGTWVGTRWSGQFGGCEGAESMTFAGLVHVYGGGCGG